MSEQKFGVLLTTLTNRNDFNDAVSELQLLNCPNLELLVYDPFKNNKSVSFNQAQKALESFLLRFNPVAIVSLSSFEKLDSIIPISKSRLFKRLVILYDLIPLQSNRELLVSNFQKTSYHWALTNLSTSDCLLSISRESEATWRRLVSNDSKIKVIHGAGYGSSKPKYSPSNISRSGIVCVGAEQRHKNIPNLIKAYSLLDPSVRDLHKLTIVGIHPRGARAKLVKFSKSLTVSINLPSYLTNLELEDLYLSNKLLVMPSLVEGLSMPILEAWELGLPAVGSAGTVAEELIVDSELLFDPNDVTSIAATIQNVLTNETAWQRAVKSSSNKANQYSWESTAKLLLEAVSEETKHD
jgi:glycosyltransferase involved in cell wall biosynthesis